MNGLLNVKQYRTLKMCLKISQEMRRDSFIHRILRIYSTIICTKTVQTTWACNVSKYQSRKSAGC